MADRSCARSWLSLQLQFGIGCLAMAVAAGCAGEHKAEAPAATKAEIPTITAPVLRVQSSLLPEVVRTQGSLMADEVTVVGAKVAGRISAVEVDLGDKVQGDAPLATIDQEAFRLEVALAEAQLTQSRAALGLKPDAPLEQLNPENAPPVREARAVWDEARQRVERLQPLRARNAVTQEELDQVLSAEQVADARYTSALNSVLEKIALIRVRSAELALAKQRLTECVIMAPYEGIIQARHVSPGAFVQVGDPIVTLVRTSTLRFRGTLPERHALRLEIGQEVRLSIESVDIPYVARITRISPVVNESNRALSFEAAVPNQDGRLQTGLFAEGEVILDPNARSIVVPPSALTEFAGTEKAWRVVDGMAQEQVVVTGRRSESGIEVLSGLSDGDVILHDASQGQVARVTPLETSSPGNPVALTQAAGPENGTSGDATQRAKDAGPTTAAAE